MMFFSQYFSFHCQYHSTNAPYSFIQLPPTLYDVFLQILQFPLSVSFHQCSILIHSTTTDVIWCFSHSTSVSPVSIIPPMLHTHSFIYHRRYIMFFSQYFSFPCQYHSTNSPYSFIQLPPSLNDVFSPSTSVFPVSKIPPMLHTHLHLHASLTRKKNGETCNPLKNRQPFRNRVCWTGTDYYKLSSVLKQTLR